MTEQKFRFYPPDLADRKSALAEACRFPWEFLEKKKDRVIDGNLGWMFRDLQNGRFWGVLERIDGHYDPTKEYTPEGKEAATKERESRRSWARDTFAHFELQQLFDICVQCALIAPDRPSRPGELRGHSILFNQLYAKEDSMFRGAITDDVRKRLNNGRLWEEIPNMDEGVDYGFSYSAVGDVLTNYFADLSVDFTPEGLKIFARNDGEKQLFNLRHLSRLACNRYRVFLRQIDNKRDQLGIKQEQLAFLVGPYVVDAIEDRDEEGYERTSIRNGLVRKLHDSLIADYLTNSEVTRDQVAKQLELEAVDGHGVSYITEVLDSVPDAKEMFDRMVTKMTYPQGDLLEIIKKSKDIKLDLKPYFGPHSLSVLHSK